MAWNPIIRQGATWNPSFRWTQGSTAVNITGYTMWMQIRQEKNSSATLLELSSTAGDFSITNATNGQWELSVTSTVTAALTWADTSAYYDMVVTGGGKKYRRLEGKVTLSKGVTRS